ncbi:MAG: T9SS type A sorting domain-containing protein [Gemmatimonadetes bacterium]|jgi:fibronectin type 3 domain-containing protein|nr:T9SS type A sorting domain-containing protein [Gemmatimonadota bacterium]MBT5058273.1 T9SS type A sorting domain-containing protein [Gemmatimonadota bacterium]MBT5146628.1 T9SS type A sorting domain-containing protein [Gemmatimonadota bacterium]MBT5964800.1 T9SS type A sorting domain-containing protein [Gemmatimonadota bacterium]MBT6628238.1 T9SS type A sorting domain-containing protein [Gemmatimonadota bacterium]
MKRTFLTSCIEILLLCGLAAGGLNDGFTVHVRDASTLVGPQIGDVVTLTVVAAGVSEIKGHSTEVAFDAALLSFDSFVGGDLLGDAAVDVNTPPVEGSDGLTRVEGASALIGANETRVTDGGVLGTFTFHVVGDVAESGSFLSIVAIELRTSPDDADRDALQLTPGSLGRALNPRFANQIFNVDVQRRFNGAALSWESRFTGLADSIRVRQTGQTEWIDFGNPALAATDSVALRGAGLLLAGRIALADTITPAAQMVLANAGIETEADGFEAELLRLYRQLRTRRHVVSATALSADTQFEYQAHSFDLLGRRSNTQEGNFRTRLAPDVRPASGSDLDVQTTQTTASTSWFTNRPADTQLLVIAVASVDTVLATQLDGAGSLVHAALAEGLTPDTEYSYVVTSRLVDVDDLIEQNLLTQEQVSFSKTGTFRTRAAGRPLRLLVPPSRVVSSNNAVITARLNQITGLVIDYGVVDDPGSAEYSKTLSSSDILNTHAITLPDLDPATTYRFRLRLATPDGDTLSTDPRGNFQWSRDLQFRTSALGDTLPPVIIEGPFVVSRDVLAVVRFVTDVDTRATVFFGTSGGTYGTADEFEIPDKTVDGSLRLTQEHAITISGLEPGAAYQYGIIVEATNNRTTSFEPGQGSGKRSGVLQPPGGAGAFTTNNQADTQFPVILAGPSIASKTHATAVVEWTTDEPTSADVRFGTQELDGQEGTGLNSTRHKIVLSNLEAGQTYSYIVGATDASGNGATESALAVFTTNPEVDLTAPVVTEAPRVIYRNDEVATIQWTTDEDASGEVHFGTSTDLDFIRTLSGTNRVHEATLTNLAPETTYYFDTRSSDLSNNGPTTTTIDSFTTDAVADATAPVISAAAVQAADSTAILTWATDELADSFVNFGTVSGLLNLTVGNAEDGTEHEVILTNLAPATTYFFSVGSIDRAGNGPVVTAQASFTTSASADVEAPQTPTALTGSGGNGQVLLAWNDNSELDLAGYNVYRRLQSEDEFSLTASRLAEAAYTDLGVANNVGYDYRITAIDRNAVPNESEPTTVLALTPTLSAAPTVASGLSVLAESLRPTLIFNDAVPFANGAELTYTIQVSTKSDFSDVTASTSGVAGGTGQISWTLTRDLDNGATYFWRVRAVEGALTGPFTETLEFTVDAALLPGDFNNDGSVDFDDFFAFVAVFGSPVAEAPRFDLDGSNSGIIDFSDFFAFVAVFGTRSAGKSWGFAHRLDEDASIRLQATASIMGTDHLGKGSTHGIDDKVQLRIWMDGARAVSAFGLVLGYDPQLVEFVAAEEGPGHLLASRGGHTGLFTVRLERPGTLLISNGLSQGQPVDGRGMLAELSFRLRDRQHAGDASFVLHEAYVANKADDIRRVMDLSGTDVVPLQFALAQAYPNPFNPSTQIEFALAHDTPASLIIYDVIGQRVRTLLQASDDIRAGYHTLTWDGTDEQDRAVGNGLYFYRLVTPAFQRTGKMMLIK